jgi:uncharacterized protein (DUF305 family)
MIFKCLASGNTVEFTAAHDIEAMLKHHQYAVVEEAPAVVKETTKVEVKTTTEGK